MGPYFNGIGMNGLKTPEQLAQEYQQIMQNYQNLYRNLNPNMSMNPMQNNFQSPASQSVSTNGDYRAVKNFSEVEQAPTRLDGTASLFFDFDNMVFWSKKFINGQHMIQPYKFMALNNDNVPEEPAKESTKEDSNLLATLTDMLDKLTNRLDKLEQNFNAYTEPKKVAEITVTEG